MLSSRLRARFVQGRCCVLIFPFSAAPGWTGGGGQSGVWVPASDCPEASGVAGGTSSLHPPESLHFLPSGASFQIQDGSRGRSLGCRLEKHGDCFI